jgi:hypothetical protein
MSHHDNDVMPEPPYYTNLNRYLCGAQYSNQRDLRFLLRPAPSVANLPSALTINSITKSPYFEYFGIDASAAGFAQRRNGGATAARRGSGTALAYLQGSPLLGALDDSVKGAGTGAVVDNIDCYRPAVADLALATEDFFAVALFQAPTVDPSVAFIARTGLFAGGGFPGWDIDIAGGLVARVRLLVPPATAIAINAGTCVAGAIYLACWGVDRSENSANGAMGFLNAVAGAGVDASASSGVYLSGVDQASLLASPTGTYGFGGKLLYLAGYKHADWFPGGATNVTQWTAAAATLQAQLLGLYPSPARGTALPTAMTRASAAYLDKLEGTSRKLYYVGANWIRTCKRADINGAVDSGVLISATATNTCLQSEDITTTWALGATATRAANSAVAPDGTTTADTLSAVANGDYIKQTFAAITAVARAYSHYIKRNGAGDVAGFIRLVKTSDGSTIAETAFTATDEWQRFQVTGTCVLNDTEVRIVITTAGESLYVWGGQVELGNIASSYIPTTTAAVARAVDSLIYNGNNFPAARGKIRVKVLREAHAPAAASYMLNADDTSANERHSLVLTTGKKAEGVTVDGGVTQADITSAADLSNGNWHTVEYGYALDFVRLTLDGTAEAADVAATMPAASSALRIGAYSTTGSEFGGLINRVEVYNK